MEITHDFKELERRVMLGDRLTESELSALEADLSLRAMQKRGGYDFGRLDFINNCGNLEANFLKEQNARFAKKGPSNKGGYVNPGFGGCLIRRDECIPTPVSSVPDFTPPPPGWEGQRSIERALENHRFRLKQVTETRVLPD